MKRKINYVLMVLLLALSACSKNEPDMGTKKLSPTIPVDSDLATTPAPTTKPVPAETKAPTKPVGEVVTPVTELVTGDKVILGNSQANLIALGYVCEHAGKLYYRDVNHEAGLCSVNRDGTGKQVLTKDKPQAIQVVGEYIYFINENFQIKRIKLDGSGEERIGNETAGAILVSGDWIYIGGEANLKRMSADGSVTEVLYPGEEKVGNEFGWINLYGDCVIGGGVGNKGWLRAVKTDGSISGLIAKKMIFPAVTEEFLYGYHDERKGVLFISLKTGEETVWKSGYAGRVNYYEGRLYFTDNRAIYVCENAEEGPKLIYNIKEEPSVVAVEFCGAAADKLFFTEQYEKEKDGKIFGFRYYDLATGEFYDMP